MVANAPCATEHKKSGWAPCNPIECDGSRIPYADAYKQQRLSSSTAFLEPNQPEHSELVFPCNVGYEKGTIVFVCNERGIFKPLNHCIKLNTTTSVVPVTCDGTPLAKEAGHSDRRYGNSTAYLAPRQPLGSTLILGCTEDPRDGSITFVCEADGMFRTRENCTG